MPNNMLDGAQVIVDYLIRQKVPYAFGLCGHGNIQFIDALFERQSDIKTISVHHESVCGFMADVYYRVSGQPVATFTSCGPGSVNLPIALATAYLDSVPFLAVTGNVPTSAVQPRRVPGALPPASGRLPLHRPHHVQEGVPADPRRAGAADGAAGLEDDGDRPARPGGARRAVRRVRGGRRRGNAAAGGMERQHLVALRRRSRGRGEGGRHAARRRAAGDPDRPGREVFRAPPRSCARSPRSCKSRSGIR